MLPAAAAPARGCAPPRRRRRGASRSAPSDRLEVDEAQAERRRGDEERRRRRDAFAAGGRTAARPTPGRRPRVVDRDRDVLARRRRDAPDVAGADRTARAAPSSVRRRRRRRRRGCGARRHAATADARQARAGHARSKSRAAPASLDRAPAQSASSAATERATTLRSRTTCSTSDENPARPSKPGRRSAARQLDLAVRAERQMRGTRKAGYRKGKLGSSDVACAGTEGGPQTRRARSPPRTGRSSSCSSSPNPRSSCCSPCRSSAASSSSRCCSTPDVGELLSGDAREIVRPIFDALTREPAGAGRVRRGVPARAASAARR